MTTSNPAVAGPSITEGPITVALATAALATGQQTKLIVRLAHEPGVFVFGEPVPDGYVALTVSVGSAADITTGQASYPATKPFAVEGIDDVFYVLQGDVAEIDVPISLRSAAADTVTLNVAVHYQACDQVRCHLPREVELSLEVPVSRSG